MGKTESESVMGFVEVNINGQWMNLMSMSVSCPLCNEEVIIAHLAKAENADMPNNATWTCKKCHAING
jgi:DNA-directed RNA polymerase subunit M/transcription elongation factor TFIIS